MWNLSGDDVQRAKEEMNGRRAAIQARYDSEIKQLESAIGDLETFERTALEFVLNFKGEAAPPAQIAEPEPPEQIIAADSADEQASAEPEPEPEPAAAVFEPAGSERPGSDRVHFERVASEKSSSRWRMRLGATEVSP